VTLNTITASSQSGEHLRLLELCYRYAYLNGRKQAGLTLSHDEEAQLESLGYLFEGDPLRRRRQHRRFPLLLHAVVKLPDGLCSGQVLDMSGVGMFVTTAHEVEPGDTVQVKLGRPGEVEYLFTCTVVRRTHDARSDTYGVGLLFCCVPLEMRRAA
jgi:hypothetical protein